MGISVCLGIDLGTTNSTIAWGDIDPKTVQPNVIDIQVNGYPRVKSLLSCRYSDVTEILENLINGVQHILRVIDTPEKLVITVPICQSRRNDAQIIDAAKNAKIDEQKIVLLREDWAALHYFCYRNRESTTLNHIDFSEPKFCLLFDLGGGTLDVSLHKVSENGVSLYIDPIVEPTGTGPCGDDFDKLVAEKLLKIYCDLYKLSLNNGQKNVLKPQFQVYAKEVKEVLYNGLHIQKTPSLPEKSLRSFSPTLSPNEYKQIVTPFLAPCLDLKSRYDPKGEDIINPVLYVLDEAQRKLKRCNRPKVDVVLLNGGMTRLEIIRERLEDFFGPGVVKNEEEFDPENAVVKGAVVYQAYQ